MSLFIVGSLYSNFVLCQVTYRHTDGAVWKKKKILGKQTFFLKQQRREELWNVLKWTNHSDIIITMYIWTKHLDGLIAIIKRVKNYSSKVPE